MLPEEDEAPQSDHSYELGTDLGSPFPNRRRRVAQVAVVACMLAASGLLVLAFTEHQRAQDDERALESEQATQVQDGWKTLGAVAAQDARATDAQNAAAQPQPAATVPPAAPPPATTNIVIVNPAQQGAQSSAGVAAPSVATTAPSPNVGARTNTVYVPTVLPSVGTNRNIPGQDVSNGSVTGSQANPGLSAVPGSQTNPALSATPSPPSAPVSGVPSTPVGSVPASPPATDLSP